MKKEDENIRTGGGGVDEEAVAVADINSPPELLQQDQDDRDVTLPSQSLPNVVSTHSVTNTTVSAITTPHGLIGDEQIIVPSAVITTYSKKKPPPPPSNNSKSPPPTNNDMNAASASAIAAQAAKEDTYTAAAAAQENTEILDGGASGGDDDTTEEPEEEVPVTKPGAIRVYPSYRAPSPADDSAVFENQLQEQYGQDFATSPDSPQSNHQPIDAEIGQSQDVTATAYVVEAPQEATVVETYFGIERKRLMWLLGGAFVVIIITLGVVLGVLLPQRGSNTTNQKKNVCGSLCGTEEGIVVEGLGVPNPDFKVFGSTCTDWEFNSTTLPKPMEGEGTCAETYDPAAYGCGCESAKAPENGCGTLCSDGSEIPNPDQLVIDIHFNEMSCRDFELKSLFETDPNECVHYNAMGVICGCPSNEPHSEACGPLCGEGETFLHHEEHPVWDSKCREWNIMSTYLPNWYNNDGNESCEEYYQDVRYVCACPQVTTPPATCGKLCQDRRICEPICSDGSEVPDPDFIVRRESCQGWELWARTEVLQKFCPFYHMTGAMCGCDNEPPQDTCGPLCGAAEILPDPDKLVNGQSCSDWDYASRYLPSSYELYQTGNNGIIRTCSDYFDRIAYGCGCQSSIQLDGCGPLCKDGSPVPDPEKVVGGRTCRDIELYSLFEKDLSQCTFYNTLASAECGCPGARVEYTEPCFKMEHLQNQTYYEVSSPSSFFVVEFKEGGVMAAILSNGNFVTLGIFKGIEDGVAYFGGGAWCAVQGPRTGVLQIVEDEQVTEPTLGDFYEPSICVAKATLRVPKFCSTEDDVRS